MLRALATAVLAAGLVAAAEEAAKDKSDAKAELKRFTGTWVGVKATNDGKEVGAEKMRLTVDGEKYVFESSEGKVEGTHEVDPTAKPKKIDATRKSGKGEGKTLLGIYELTDTTFR